MQSCLAHSSRTKLFPNIYFPHLGFDSKKRTNHRKRKKKGSFKFSCASQFPTIPSHLLSFVLHLFTSHQITTTTILLYCLTWNSCYIKHVSFFQCKLSSSFSISCFLFPPLTHSFCFFACQKQLASMVEKASIEDVMKVLLASRKQDMQQLWATCSHLVAKSGLPPEVLAKHLPIDIVAKIEELRIKSSMARRSLVPHHHHHHPHHHHAALDLEDQKIRRMRRALDSSDVELVKLMVMGEGLNLDEALALPYAVENCSREVVKALLELGAADVNYPSGPAGKTPLHIAAEMVSPDMVAVLLDHHADPNVRTVDGVTPLDILRTLTSDFLFKGAVPGLTHIEPNKLRLCLELVQSAALVMSREEGNANNNNAPSNSAAPIYPPPMNEDHNSSSSSGNNNNNIGNLNLDSRLVYLNLGATASMSSRLDGGEDEREAMNTTMYHHHSHDF